MSNTEARFYGRMNMERSLSSVMDVGTRSFLFFLFQGMRKKQQMVVP